MFRSFFRKLDGFVQRYPLPFSVGSVAVKAALADACVQLTCDEEKEYDWKRTGLFAVFGGGYQGGFQFVAFRYFERLWPGRAAKNVINKVLATNLFLDPVFFFPVFYTMKETMKTNEFTKETVSTALTNYQKNHLTDWMVSWSIWFPGHLVTYTFIPPHWRMPWVATISFAYCCVLSKFRGTMVIEPPQPPPKKYHMQQLEL